MPHSTTSPSGINGAATATTAITAKEPLPYWLVNVPPSERPAECPEFLLNQNEKNIQILSVPDEDYHKLNWDAVKEIIS